LENQAADKGDEDAKQRKHGDTKRCAGNWLRSYLLQSKHRKVIFRLRNGEKVWRLPRNDKGFNANCANAPTSIVRWRHSHTRAVGNDRCVVTPRLEMARFARELTGNTWEGHAREILKIDWGAVKGLSVAIGKANYQPLRKD